MSTDERDRDRRDGERDSESASEPVEREGDVPERFALNVLHRVRPGSVDRQRLSRDEDSHERDHDDQHRTRPEGATGLRQNRSRVIRR